MYKYEQQNRKQLKKLYIELLEEYILYNKREKNISPQDPSSIFNVPSYPDFVEEMYLLDKKDNDKLLKTFLTI